MLPYKRLNSNLSEELSILGLTSDSTNQLSESRISEETYSPTELTESSESLEYSNSSNSPYVSQDTLDRVECLIDTGNLSDEDAENLIEGLIAKSPTEETQELYYAIVDQLKEIQEMTEDVDLEDDDINIESALYSIMEGLEAGELSPAESFRVLSVLLDAPLQEGLEDIKDEIIEAILMDEGFRTMLKKIKGAFKKVRVKRGTSAERAKSRQKYRKRRGKIKLQRKKRGRKASVKRGVKLLKRARAKFGMESDELATRLASRALAESTGTPDEFDMLGRIGRIFESLQDFVSDDVIDIMEEHYDILRRSLLESNADLETACRPCIAIIAECMKDVENQGND
ncbi:hypothetical protein CL629_02370 [bacterium]|nr:hypothetical protein [bacterium]|tara:strand:- start:3765 stop:4790 length:1026 start_codon:yes stop_codon:yes gene_type:complete